MDPLLKSLFVTAVLTVLVGSVSTEAEVIGVYRDWTAVTSVADKKKTCMMWSQPKQSKGYSGKRGDAFAFVTHQPGEKRLNRVSFEAGYAMPGAPEVRVQIGDERFSLSAGGTGAWAKNSQDDKALIEAMRAGRTMTVESKAGDGKRVRDSYSLLGFTAAYKAIGAACNVR